MSRVVDPDAYDVVGMHGRPPLRRSSNAWGEVDVGSPGDDDSRSARSDSQYTDADSVASDAFESGAEDISDDESSRPRGSRADSADALARDIGAGMRLDPREEARGGIGGRDDDGDRGEGRGAHSHHPASSTQNDFSEAEVREAFAAFDEDGDGYLGVADVQSFFEALGETLTVAETAELVRLVDRDDDGLVDFDEFFDLATRSAQFVDADATRE
jgi:hypothetical protein